MIVNPREYDVRGLYYIIRSATEVDAKNLSEVRLQIDGETEYLDREQGEAYIDEAGFKKIVLNVLETNEKAIKLYEKFGFEVEGVLKKDKVLSDGNYYNTIIMGRFNG